jgi:hypothetical protein
MRRNKRFSVAGPGALVASLLLALVMLSDAPARADDTIKRPGDHPSYSVEIEPHLLIGWGGWGNFYGGNGWGVGARFGIPIVQNGFVPSINNSVAISFGVDIVHYDGCWWNQFGNCNANYFDFPVTLQWNFFVAHHWSVFGEPGLFIYHGFLSDCPGPNVACNARPSDTGIAPAFFIGGRYHFSNTMALTMRLGFPTFSLGFSFMP